MEIVSGLGEKPHVTSQQFRQILEGTIGQESYIVTSGENLEPELAASNLLKIRSGMMSHHGNVSSVNIGTYDEVELTNGSQGMKRIDIVVNRYTRNAETNIEKNEWVVIMGTPVASNPVAPAYTVGNLQKGDLVDDCPVFELHYDGINVTEVKKMLSVLPNVAELNSNILKSLMPYKVGYKVLAIPAATETSVRVLSVSEINKLFGVTDASRGNTMAMFANGNGDNQTVHVEGATFKNDYWFAVMDSGVLKQDIQINYVVWYFGSQTPASNNTGTAKMQKKTATPTQTTQVVTPDTGYDGLSSVTVSAIPYEESDGESGGTTVNIG